MSALVFIDTNILLDFYRVPGRDKSLSILDHLDGNHDHFITGNQVEMEFKKNRQRLILEAYNGIKVDRGGVNLPAFLAESKQSKALARNEAEAKKLAVTMRARTARLLKNPTVHDPVYKVVQRLFRCESDYNLDRDKKIRYRIRHLARKRFMLGYPPRKDSDTSIGDAINWEWIVHCATESGKDVVLVSRDSDFGKAFDGAPMLNDWLLGEFRERVSKKRRIMLTDRLSHGLKEAKITVSKEEVREEEEFLKTRAAFAARLLEARKVIARVPLGAPNASLMERFRLALGDEDWPDPGDDSWNHDDEGDPTGPPYEEPPDPADDDHE